MTMNQSGVLVADVADPPPAELTLRVQRLTPEAEGVVSVGLARGDGAALPSWTPGSHIDVHLGSGVVRQYSLCGDPAEVGSWTVAVLRQPAGRGGSLIVHDSLEVGQDLPVSLPRNHFPLVSAQRYVFVAGGIGITPLLPMMGSLPRSTPWRLIYGGRSAASMAFIPAIQGLGGDLQLRPQDVHGLLDLPSLLADVDTGTAVYCCGPEPLIDAVEHLAQNWPAGTLHVERFRPRERDDAGLSRSFVVHLARSGATVPVPADVTIVDALAANGIRVPTSCLEGVCGTCETRVLDGRPDHRDSVLSEEERDAGDVMMICCSRALSDQMTLDL